MTPKGPRDNGSVVPGRPPARLPRRSAKTTVTHSSITIFAFIFLLGSSLPEAHAAVGFGGGGGGGKGGGGGLSLDLTGTVETLVSSPRSNEDPSPESTAASWSRKSAGGGGSGNRLLDNGGGGGGGRVPLFRIGRGPSAPSISVGARYDFGRVWYGATDAFMTLKWEGRDLCEVMRGGRGRNVVRGLSGEAAGWTKAGGGWIAEEKTESFDAVPPPAMGGPKINPDEPGDDGSETSSLDEESKENHGKKSHRKWKRAKGREKSIQTGALLQALSGCELRASVETNDLPDRALLRPPAVQCAAEVRLSRFLDADGDPYPGPEYPSLSVRYDSGSAGLGSGTEGDGQAVLTRRARTATTSFRAPLSRRVDIVSRSTFVLDNDDGACAPYLLSKTVPPVTSRSDWASGSWMPDVRMNAMGKVTAKSEAGFAVRGRGHRTGVRISVRRSVDWTLLGNPADREGGGYDDGEEGTAIRLEICGADGIGGAFISAAIKATLERPAKTARLTLTRESVFRPR